MNKHEKHDLILLVGLIIVLISLVGLILLVVSAEDKVENKCRTFCHYNNQNYYSSNLGGYSPSICICQDKDGSLVSNNIG